MLPGDLGSTATDVNDLGTIVGLSGTPVTGAYSGVIWNPELIDINDVISDTAHSVDYVIAINESGELLAITAYADGLLLEPRGAPASDLDGDGAVSLGDLGLLLADFGCSGGSCAGDVDDDGATTKDDLVLMLNEFGNSCH